ncbi:hypothetical protein [Actinokineospora spheciospongiae]|uniref:hypothetical protein n=1 Tax=Actinokineospora spheciospongiae TaxID=909613 RepID=UPI000D717EE9|nr:hypothetical protein [Actinokineospora spheciospongiae]PWW61839.1 hypothetical protein DFQ13_10686 [Actinokineospora spheciospongiae]
MTSAFQSIGNSLGDIVASRAGSINAPGGGTGGGGQFAFEPDEVKALAQAWAELAQSYQKSQAYVRRIEVEGPGDEPASSQQAMAAMDSWAAYADSLSQKLQYSRGQAQKFTGALADYLGTDQESVAKMLGIETSDPAAQGGI